MWSVAVAGHALTIFELTVRSPSSLALLRSNACCLQSARFMHAWCSGIRCYRVRQFIARDTTSVEGTHRAAEVVTTVCTLAYNAQGSLVALGLSGELAALLGGHGME